MTFKMLLAPFSGKEHEESALKVACFLAQQYGAHAEVVYVCRDPQAHAAGAGIAFSPSMLRQIEETITKENKESEAASHAYYESICQKAGISFDSPTISSWEASASWHVEKGNIETLLTHQGRITDLIVMGRDIEDDLNYEHAWVTALFETGRPTLMIPPNYDGEPGKSIVIAWNGSAEAARAIHYSIPFLQRAEKIHVLTIKGQKESDFPMTSLLNYLALHDLDAKELVIKNEGLSTGEALLKGAETVKADMLVLGAFSHARLRQMILGGVTQFMLKNSTIPILMAH